MLNWMHEKSHAGIDPYGSQQEATVSHGRGDPRRLDWDKDCCFVAGAGRSASWMDNRGLGPNAHEPDSVDSCGERRRAGGLKIQAQTWKTRPISPKASENSRGPLGGFASKVWVESSSVGRPHVGGSLKASLRDNPKSKAGPEVDASAGIPPEAGQLLVSSSSIPRGQEVPQGFKKNLGCWVPRRLWSSRTRQALACIPDWAEGGP